MSHEAKSQVLPFAAPSISEDAIAEVVACLRSGQLASGPRVQDFERQFAAYVGAPHALALTSATAGLFLALQALEVGPGDEVILPAMTFVASANVVAQLGAKPVFVDVDPKTYQMDADATAAAVTPRTRVIMPVHFAGVPVDLDPIYALAQDKRLRVVEDAAHAVGAWYKDKKIGGFGDIQVFSFHPNKNMTTGEGGMLTTQDADVAEKVATMRFHGIVRPEDGGSTYDVVAPGYKFNMSDIAAALGRHQLSALDNFLTKRAALVDRYRDKLVGLSGLVMPQLPAWPHRPAWHLFAVCVNSDAPLGRDALMSALKARGVGSGLHYTPVHLFSYYKQAYGYAAGDFPAAEAMGASVLSLPLYPDMQQADQDRVIAALTDIWEDGQ